MATKKKYKKLEYVTFKRAGIDCIGQLLGEIVPGRWLVLVLHSSCEVDEKDFSTPESYEMTNAPIK